MDIVRHTNIARLTIFSFLSVLVLSACLPEGSSSSSGDKDDASPSDELKIIPPADRQSEATGVLTVVSPGRASAQGGVGNYTFDNDAPANGFPLGETTVTWTVVDGAGSESSGIQSVRMSDTTAPAITVPPGIQTASTAPRTVMNIGMATAVDLVDPNPAISNDSPANGFPPGTTRVTWTATDASGNTSFATQMITIAPVVPGSLTLTPPAPVTMAT